MSKKTTERSGKGPRPGNSYRAALRNARRPKGDLSRKPKFPGGLHHVERNASPVARVHAQKRAAARRLRQLAKIAASS